MKLIHMVCFVLLFTAGQGLHAQKTVDIWHPPIKKGIANLKVGDVVPDFRMEKIFNGDKKTAMVSDFKDQLLILDFGNTQCPGCVAALPHMDSLEQRFGNKLSIFWVTPEPEEKVQKFWSENKYVKGIKIRTIVEDSTFLAAFRHLSWPHEAWIYRGKVIAITGPEYVDAANIEKVLSGQIINWPVKNDFYAFDGKKQPLFILNTNQPKLQEEMKTAVKKYVALGDYREGINAAGFSGGSGIVRDSVNTTLRYFFINEPIYNAYLRANIILSNGIKRVKPAMSILIGPNEVRWEVQDINKYKYTSKAVSGYTQDWVRKYGICFESFSPDTGQTDEQVYQQVWNEQNMVLGLDVHWEKRKEKVLVIKGTGSQLTTKGAIANDESNYQTKGNLHSFRNTDLNVIAYMMNSQPSNPYVFNETAYKGKADLELNIPSWTDISAVRKALAGYGLELQEEERLVDKLVFKEADFKEVDARLPVKKEE